MNPPVVGLRGALTPAVRGEQSVRPHDAQHPRAGDSDPVQDPKPCVDLAMAFAVERGPREIGPNRRQQLRVRLTVSELMPVVYDELRRLARHYLAQERAPQTIQATALVHEAYLRLPRRQGARPGRRPCRPSTEPKSVSKKTAGALARDDRVRAHAGRLQ